MIRLNTVHFVNISNGTFIREAGDGGGKLFVIFPKSLLAQIIFSPGRISGISNLSGKFGAGSESWPCRRWKTHPEGRIMSPTFSIVISSMVKSYLGPIKTRTRV